MVVARKLEHGFRRIRARIPILYLKAMRIMMFQLSGYYYTSSSKGKVTESFKTP